MARRLKIGGVVAAVLLALIFIGQNTEVVGVRVFFWELSMSRIVLLSGSIGLGFAVGWIVAKLTGKPTPQASDPR